MSQYIDGFALPIPRKNLNDYQGLVEQIADIWREHGAIEYREFVGDDMHLDGTRSFSDALEAQNEEVIVFGWVLFDSKESRDFANKKVAEDPRIASLTGLTEAGFDASRMVYGGFSPLVINADCGE